MLQNTPHEVYVHIGCASSLYLFEDLFNTVPILQNKMRVIIAVVFKKDLNAAKPPEQPKGLGGKICCKVFKEKSERA